MYKTVIRPLLFRFDPEQVHQITIQLLCGAGNIPPVRGLLRRTFAARSQKDLSVEVFGLTFSNPVGLAAGYDKDGLGWQGLSTLGFGHIEVGTVTPRAQAGNPKPRVFRIPEEQAVINRMGFPGKGADFVAKQLSNAHRSRSDLVVGVNIGKNKETPNEDAAQDYLYLYEKFSPIADYLAVNVSSPNTVGLRRLQARDFLEELLKSLVELRVQSSHPRPILVKLAPDLTDEELDDSLAAITNSRLDGVIATNTTISRAGLKSKVKEETGGLSGNPLTEKSARFVQKIHERTSGKLPIVGVGGIMNVEDAKRMFDSGASLVQVYTGLIYEGPGLVKRIIEGI